MNYSVSPYPPPRPSPQLNVPNGDIITLAKDLLVRMVRLRGRFSRHPRHERDSPSNLLGTKRDQ